jgi:hypothetical protein
MDSEKPQSNFWVTRGMLLAEWLLIAVIFAAAGAWPVPDVNESHYLAKARHAVDPSWCAGDFFLESQEAHGLFFRLLGPLTTVVSLPLAAWIGRWLGWLALAIGFRHAVAGVLAGMGRRLLAAALFSLALRFTTMAGEWLIGGCEAKVFAWAAVLAAWGEIAAGRWRWAWILGGLATAWHPIVGGWMMLVTGGCFLVDRRAFRGAAPCPAMGNCSIRSGLAVALGMGLAAVGLWPALQLAAGVPLAVQQEAARIYVVDRLPHHLLPRTFPEALVSRHLLAIAIWWVLAGLLPASASRQRMAWATLAALGLSLAGWIISLGEAFAPAATYGLLRYYWFRLADGLVPLALAVATTAVCWPDADTQKSFEKRPWPAALAVALLILLLVDLGKQTQHWPLPGRSIAPRSDKRVAADAWQDACDWIRRETPTTAVFLTPRGSGSFHWWAERAEVVSWKNIPQDPAGIVAWRQRVLDCFSFDGTLTSMSRSTVAFGPQRLNQVANRYGVDFILAPQSSVAVLPKTPPVAYRNAGYVVLGLPLPQDEAQQVTAR